MFHPVEEETILQGVRPSHQVWWICCPCSSEQGRGGMSQPVAECALRVLSCCLAVQHRCCEVCGIRLTLCSPQTTDFCGFMSKTELQAAAQPHCDASFTTVSVVAACTLEECTPNFGVLHTCI